MAKIASISVVGQHSFGLDMHVRNLRWALSGMDHQIYLFVLKCEFDRSLYSDVVFIEREGKSKKKNHFNFWLNDIPDLVRSCSEDTVLFSQQDMFYKRKIPLGNSIIVNAEKYNCPITINNKEVYPRLWEGGMIVHRQLLLDALDYGISFTNTIQSDKIIERTKNCSNEMFIGRRLDSLKVGDSLDTLGEFCIYCYLQKEPVIKLDLLTHFHPLDSIVKKYPCCYGPELTQECLDILSKLPNPEHPILMYYISGRYALNDLLVQFFKSCKPGKFLEMRSHAKQWMSLEQFKRYEFVLSFLNKKSVKLL